MSGPRGDRIQVRGLQVYARHGVLDEEAVLGQRFVLDIAAMLDLAEAGRTDVPAATVSYADIVAVAAAAMTERRFRLIEAAAEAVADALFRLDSRIHRLAITLHKPAAPIEAVFDDVAVTIERDRPTAG